MKSVPIALFAILFLATIFVILLIFRQQTLNNEYVTINSVGDKNLVINNQKTVNDVKERLSKYNIDNIIVHFSEDKLNQIFTDMNSPEEPPVSFTFKKDGNVLNIWFNISNNPEVRRNVSTKKINTYINRGFYVAIYSLEFSEINRTDHFLKSYEEILLLGEKNYPLQITFNE